LSRSNLVHNAERSMTNKAPNNNQEEAEVSREAIDMRKVH